MVLSPVFRVVPVFFLFTCISSETVFSQKFSSLTASTCKKNNRDFFYDGCSIFFIDLNSNMGLTLYLKWVEAQKMHPVSHLTMHYFQKTYYNSQGVMK